MTSFIHNIYHYRSTSIQEIFVSSIIEQESGAGYIRLNAAIGQKRCILGFSGNLNQWRVRIHQKHPKSILWIKVVDAVKAAEFANSADLANLQKLNPNSSRCVKSSIYF